VSVETSVSPHFGVAYDPLSWLHLSGTVHSRQQFVIETSVAATLPAGQESGTSREAVHSILPWQFGLGAEVDLIRDAPHTFSLVGGLRYALWSDYKDRHGETPGDDDPDLAFDDVFSGSAGVRHQRGPLRSFLDFTYEPTPVPPQVGRRNYVDNDRVGALLGADYEFEVVKLPFRVGAQVQGQRLLHRYQAKDNARIVDELPDGTLNSNGDPVPEAAGLQTNNPGWPGFASEGWILGGALTVSLLY
jgi:hypothetical protein